MDEKQVERDDDGSRQRFWPWEVEISVSLSRSSGSLARPFVVLLLAPLTPLPHCVQTIVISLPTNLYHYNNLQFSSSLSSLLPRLSRWLYAYFHAPKLYEHWPPALKLPTLTPVPSRSVDKTQVFNPRRFHREFF